jgi:TPR repeat protein
LLLAGGIFLWGADEALAQSSPRSVCMESSGSAAIIACKAALRAAPADVEVARALAWRYSTAKRFNEALEVLNAALGRSPGHDGLLSDISVAKSNLAEQEWLKNRKTTDSEDETGTEKPVNRMDRIRCRQLSGATALAACERALAAQPNDSDLRVARARHLESMGQTTRAIDDYRAALASDPDNAEARTRLAALAPMRANVPDGVAAYNRGDYATASREMKSLAEQGFAKAQYNLGVMYDKGRGVPQDYAEAARWYRKAAEQGDADAQFNLGIMYDKGRGVPQDYAVAAKWYRRAAEKGHAKAQTNLGVRYYKGQGVPQDYAAAAGWYRKAAEQGDADAQFNLGIMYDKGRGVPQDYAVAVKWYRRAAEKGHATAQTNLGIRYHKGQGVTQDYVQAHKWYNLAVSRLPPGEDRVLAVKYRNTAASRMTAAQIAEAQRLARDWKPKRQ